MYNHDLASYQKWVMGQLINKVLEQILLKMQVNLKLYNYTGIPLDCLAILISCGIQNKIYLQHFSRSIIAVYLSGILYMLMYCTHTDQTQAVIVII